MKYKTAREVVEAHYRENDPEDTNLEGLYGGGNPWCESWPGERCYLSDVGEDVWEGNYDERRWATFLDRIIKLTVEGEDYYLMVSDYTGGGDNDADGVGYSWEGLDNVPLMEPYETTVIDYRVIESE